jgi:N-methylhydantoinase A
VPAGDDAEALKRIEVWLDGESRVAPLYRRADLAPGHRLSGPAVIMQEDTTVVIPTGFTARVDAHLNLQLDMPE